MALKGNGSNKASVKYQERRRRQVVYYFGMLGSFATAFFMAVWNQFVMGARSSHLFVVNKNYIVLLILLGLICTVLTVLNWWCPTCFRKFPSSLNMNFCPYCGTKLNS